MASAPGPDSSSAAPLPHTGQIARSAGLAGLATLASRVLGLGRETVLAAAFGAGNAMDAFYVAMRIPNLVRDLFAEGAMSAAFVPTFTRHVTLHGKTHAWHLANNVLNALLIVTGVVVGLGVLFAEPIVSVYAREYAAVPGKLDLTIQLARVVWPFLTLAAIAAAIMGMLNSLHHYFIPALSPATFNVATIVCALWLAPIMPSFGYPPILAVAIGVLIGGVAQVALQWPAIHAEGFRYRPLLDPRDPGLHRILLLMGPGTLGLAATQVNLFVNTLLATSQGTGAVSWLQYAFRLMYLPIGIFGVSIATAVLPAVARQAAVDDLTAVRHTVARGIGLMLVLNVPATVGLYVLAVPIVRLLLERGLFLPDDTLATAAAVRFYALGLVGYSASRIASPVFYALHNSRIALLLTTVSVAANLVLSLLLVRVMGFAGLALATSLAAIVNGALALWLLRRRLGGIEGRHLASTFAKVVTASAVMAMAVVGVARLTEGTAPRGLLAQSLSLVVTIGAGLAALALMAHLLRIAEFDDAMAGVRRRVSR